MDVSRLVTPLVDGLLALLLGAAIFVLGSYFFSPAFLTVVKDKGARAFWATVGLSLILGSAYSVFWLIVFALLGALGDSFGVEFWASPATFWFFIFLAYASVLLFFFFKTILGLFTRTVSLVEIYLPRRDIADFTFAHLSDLHLCAHETLEGSLTRDEVRIAVHKAISWALSSSKLVLVTGDITDSGAEDEWNIFLELLDCLDPLARERLLWIPGNHDLSVQTRLWELNSMVGESLEHEQNCYRLATKGFMNCPKTWSIVTDSGLIPIRNILQHASHYIDVYRTHPPYWGTMTSEWGAAKALTFPEQIRKAAQKLETTGCVWPRASKSFRYSFSDLIELSYPMILYEDHELFVIGLNSARYMGDSMLSSGFGELGREQIERLQLALQIAGNRHTILLVHHHLGLPDQAASDLKHEYPWLQIKALQLRDAKGLCRIIENRRSCIVFHGHKHMLYAAKVGSATVISGPSVAYGDIRKKEANCFAYGMDRQGNVSIGGCKKISAREVTA